MSCASPKFSLKYDLTAYSLPSCLFFTKLYKKSMESKTWNEDLALIYIHYNITKQYYILVRII